MKADAVNAGTSSPPCSAVGVGKRCNLVGEDEGEEDGEDVAFGSLCNGVFGDVRKESGALMHVRQRRR